MDDICRLCCSTKFVNNNIFDEENALYLKMSLYLPIKVFKNDRLPQKICDKCSCKVNDFYQFCNETIEVQNRLRSVLSGNDKDNDDIIDLARIKHNGSPLPENKTRIQGTQTDTVFFNNIVEAPIPPSVPIKEEPIALLSPVKEENYDDYYEGWSDNSEDNMTLMHLKKKKTKKVSNGVEKRGRKKKAKLQDLESLINSLPDTKFDSTKTVKEEDDIKVPRLNVELSVEQVKTELDEMEAISCCICMAQYYNRNEMLQHYKQHGCEARLPTPPPAPPFPQDQDPAKCPRCKKCLSASEWCGHWLRHWQRDARAYRCALCEKAFRTHTQIFKHGQTHQKGSESKTEPRDKRFICDLCPEGFVYMRYLQAHRLQVHPEAAARALALRCGLCSRTFAHLNSLRRHLRAHSGERNHLCNVCGKALSSREHLKFHIRIHTGYKPNVCKTCGKGFVKKCNLTLHERIHSGEKPHVCAHCGKAFSQRSTLVIHERYHSGARPYACALCGRGFVAKGLLSVHLKTTCV